MKAKFTAAIAEELAEGALIDVWDDLLLGDGSYQGFDTSPCDLEDNWKEDLEERNIGVNEARLELIGNRFTKKLEKLKLKCYKDLENRSQKFKEKYHSEKVLDFNPFA